MATFTDLRNKVSNFTLNECPKGNQGFTRILIQLFGYLGHGKSSFINTCKYVMDDGEFKVYADATASLGGNTLCRSPYPLTKTMTLVDNRGCSNMNSYETGEIFAQLGNLLPLSQQVDWERGFEGLAPRIVKADKILKSSDFVYPVFVYSVKMGITPQEFDNIKNLLTIAKNLTGIFPYVVLTHMTYGDLADIESKFKQLGAEHCFALENFTPTDNMKTRGRFEGVLNFLNDVIEDVKFCLERLRDPEKERQERKTFVLKYIHEMEVSKQQQETIIKKAMEEAEHVKKMREKEQQLQMHRLNENNLLQKNEELKMELHGKKKKSKNDCKSQ